MKDTREEDPHYTLIVVPMIHLLPTLCFPAMIHSTSSSMRSLLIFSKSSLDSVFNVALLYPTTPGKQYATSSQPLYFAFFKMLQSNVAVGDIYDTFLTKRHQKQIYPTSSGRIFFVKMSYLIAINNLQLSQTSKNTFSCFIG